MMMHDSQQNAACRDLRPELRFEGRHAIPKKPRVAIAGSMHFFSEMMRLRDQLVGHGVRTLVPDGTEFRLSFDSQELYDSYRRRVSMRYLDQIRHWVTSSLLVVNFDCHGIRSYVGPSTFAEIAVASAHRKKVYVISDFPADYEEELAMWEVIPLHGRLDRLIQDYVETSGTWQSEDSQLAFQGF